MHYAPQLCVSCLVYARETKRRVDYIGLLRLVYLKAHDNQSNKSSFIIPSFTTPRRRRPTRWFTKVIYSLPPPPIRSRNQLTTKCAIGTRKGTGWYGRVLFVLFMGGGGDSSSIRITGVQLRESVRGGEGLLIPCCIAKGADVD